MYQVRLKFLGLLLVSWSLLPLFSKWRRRQCSNTFCRYKTVQKMQSAHKTEQAHTVDIIIGTQTEHTTSSISTLTIMDWHTVSSVPLLSAWHVHAHPQSSGRDNITTGLHKTSTSNLSYIWWPQADSHVQTHYHRAIYTKHIILTSRSTLINMLSAMEVPIFCRKTVYSLSVVTCLFKVKNPSA